MYRRPSRATCTSSEQPRIQRGLELLGERSLLGNLSSNIIAVLLKPSAYLPIAAFICSICAFSAAISASLAANSLS